ncbi:hypothetical protein Val02_76630 [Virgisporangium aliadipatigenens]|uniref:Flagellar basal body protein FliL n=2 Tax=Virgisporangium aliadipatigenens TaxID=741659 RepID=A0A8J3YU98_9ACTN|nr:hypothetical protein Val02_76630 [Virgisporangium aliadipatigenens]
MYGPPGGPYPDRRDGERAPRERRAWADAATRDAPPRREPPAAPPSASSTPAGRSGFRPTEPVGYRYSDAGRGEPFAGEAFPGTPFPGEFDFGGPDRGGRFRNAGDDGRRDPGADPRREAGRPRHAGNPGADAPDGLPRGPGADFRRGPADAAGRRDAGADLRREPDTAFRRDAAARRDPAATAQRREPVAMRQDRAMRHDSPGGDLRRGSTFRQDGAPGGNGGDLRHERYDRRDSGVSGGGPYDGGNWPGWADGVTWQDDSRARGNAREYDPGRPGGHAVRDVEDGTDLYRAGYDYPSEWEDPGFVEPGFVDPRYGPGPDKPGEVWAPARAPEGGGGRVTRWIVGVLCLLVLVAGGGVAYYLIARDRSAGAGDTAGPSPAAEPPAQASAKASAPQPSAAASRSSAAGPAEDARTAKVGDCLVNKGTESKPEMRRVTCAANTYQVLKRIDGTADKSKCDGTPSLTDWYFYDHPDNSRDFVLCLKKRT